MKRLNFQLASALCALCFLAGITHPLPVAAQASAGGIDVAQQPLFTATGQPPLNMLVMGKDHKIYYEAYNDASDLDGDGALDIGYKPASIDYYGYFNSHVCYVWDSSDNRFEPSSATANKQCSGKWSGDFLNYLTTSRMDALRRVLYGGWRQQDTTSDTTLQGAFFPQDGHSWGKEYQSVARDGYNIANYAPLSAPDAGKYHLFAVTTVTGNDATFPNYVAPMFRVLKNTDKRVWNWLSIEGPVAGNKCFTSSNTRVDCTSAGSNTWEIVPASQYVGLTITTWKRTSGSGSPSDRSGMDSLFSTNATSSRLCGSGPVAVIDRTGTSINPFAGTNGCGHDNYLTQFSGQISVPSGGSYRFGIDGDDAVDLQIDGNNVAGWYGGHAVDNSASALMSHSGTITLTAGTHTIRFRHQEASGGEGWGLYLYKEIGAVTRDDYAVRVQSCPSGGGNAALREASCKEYPNGKFKPTGILHDYGEGQRMFFGLITGTQANNEEGGVLRRNVSDFGEEINANTGQFKTNVKGIANTISALRMIGGGYNSGTNNLNADSNWNWANGTGNCPSIGSRAINNGECRMWGNPLAEMLYESLRYFAGAATPTTRFSTGGASQGTAEETTMGLAAPAWKDPYASAEEGGGGFLECAKPFQTVISDINPSYDGDLPGSAFPGAVTSTNNTPSTISSFNASAQGQLIWNAEFGAGSKQVFIGDVGGVTDGAPTAKSASSFGNIRGLSPEEPTKGGTYYSASVARYGRTTDVNAVPGQQNLSTYSIALASPLPRIEFPVGGGKITLLPFAKTASGTFGESATRKPTNTIVDFYVEQIVNLPGQPFDATINGGRPYAVFRINYEDVEQGNDHDMDAIVRYLISANANGTVTVTLNSEYAAGSANQNMGYVMSGTTHDGVYLEVRDSDSNNDSYYALNTPNPLLPGDCAVGSPPAACSLRLPLNSTRTFTPRAGNTTGPLQLNDPLWYAAKYGAPTDTNDTDNNGVPDNYFLVTNPATLRTQLDQAFTDIIENSQPTASVATSTPRYVANATLVYEASYKSEDWSGDLKAFDLRSDATYTGVPPVWSASEHLPAPGSRDVFTGKRNGANFTGVEFSSTGLDTALKARVQGPLDPAVYDTDDLINWLLGDQSMEQGVTGCTVPSDCPYRKRGSKIGDILNSTPAVVGVSSFGYGSILGTVAPTAAAAYADFVEDKKATYGDESENPVIYVGSNDGMLHAIDGRDGTGGGEELFAYIPNAVLDNLHELALPSYTHRYYVDGSPTVGDAYLGSWKTVLLGSVGAGGRAVYALDITDPRSFGTSDVMWEFNSSDDADMGQFVGRPYMGLTEDGNWVAAFGNGYNSASQSAILFIRDLSDGSEIAKLDTNVGCPSTEDTCTTGPNGLASAVIVDNDGNGAGDTIYAGDYLGNLWRFEYVGGSWSIGNGGAPIFKASDPDGTPQSITSGVYTVANPLGGTMVIFGTGRYLNTDDADETRIGEGTRASVESVYGIWDSRMWDNENNVWVDSQPIAARVGNDYADLERQWITGYTPVSADGSGGYRQATRNPVDFRTPDFPAGKMGWWIDLACTECGLSGGASDPLAGERITATPQGILSDVVFNTFRPEGDTCEPGSQNAVLVFDTLTGAASYIPIAPPGGWPSGQEPPSGGLLGTDTGRGPPPGEPPIVIIRPPGDPIPALCPADDEDCTTTPPEPCDEDDEGCEPPITTCSWRSPNAAGRPAGKLIPCGRISWKQLR